MLQAPLAIRKRGAQTRLVIGNGENSDTAPDEALLTVLARGHDWANRLITGEAKSVSEIAEAEGMTASYVSHVIRLGFLAPELVEAALEGKQAVEMTADALVHNASLPVRWGEQA